MTNPDNRCCTGAGDRSDLEGNISFQKPKFSIIIAFNTHASRKAERSNLESQWFSTLDWTGVVRLAGRESPLWVENRRWQRKWNANEQLLMSRDLTTGQWRFLTILMAKPFFRLRIQLLLDLLLFKEESLLMLVPDQRKNLFESWVKFLAAN